METLRLAGLHPTHQTRNGRYGPGDTNTDMLTRSVCLYARTEVMPVTC